MADTTFRSVLPALKAVDLGETPIVYGVSITHKDEAAVPTNTTFRNVSPPLKAVDLGDGTYAIAAVSQ